MRILKQSSTAQPLCFLMVQSSDHISALTGASPTVKLSKSGGSFADPTGTVTEIANGWYKVAGNATDTGTLGPLLLHATAASGDPVDIEFEVVAFDPQVAYSVFAAGQQVDFIDAPNATAVTAIQLGLSKPATAQTITPADTAASSTANSTIATNLNATVSSRSTFAAGQQVDLVNAPNAVAITAFVTAILAGTVDTVALSTLLQNLQAAAKGTVGVVDNLDGTYTLTFKKVDGTTTAFTKTYNPSTGTRT